MAIPSRVSRPVSGSLLISVMLLAAACGAVSPAAQAPAAGSSPLGPDASTLPAILGFVHDPAGAPVAYALVGGTETATDEGVVSGDFDAYEGGWIPVEAMGFASGYAKPFGTAPGWRYFETRLTPFQSLIPVGSNATLYLEGGLEGRTYLSTNLDPASLPTGAFYVGLAALDPLDVKSRFAPNQAGDELRLAYAFSLQAFDDAWLPLAAPAGSAFTIQLELDSPLTPSARFTTFDPEEGIWKQAGFSCQADTPTSLSCLAAEFNPLFAIFDQPGTSAGVAYPINTASFTLSAVLSSPIQRSATLQGEGTDGQYKGAWGNLADWLKQQEQESGGVDPNDPTLKQLVENLANAALNYAAGNRNESGKAKLLEAADVATATGQDGLANQLLDAAASLADELGEKALNESDCGEYKKLLKAAEQVMRISGNQALADQLTNKAGEMTVDCDVWDGTILVVMPRADSHPAGLPMDAKSGSWWQERHEVKIWTNVDDFVMHATDTVTLNFPTISYVKEDECKSEIKMWGSGGNVKVEFEGSFDGYTFSVSSVTPQGSGGSIQQSWEIRSKEDDQCQTVLSTTYSTQHYYSLIVHGLSSDSPPINYQEILDTSSKGRPPGGLASFGGSESIMNPDPDLGLFPFIQGSVSWHFMHTQQKLPIEEPGT